MSKATVKCPSCGKQVPAAMRYCGWCGFDMKVGASKRVESLPRPEEKTPASQPAPQPTTQPVQPTTTPPMPQPAQQPAPQPMQQPVQEPVQPVVPKQSSQPPKATKAQKPTPVQEPVPRQKPVNPNRMAAAKTPAAAKKKNSGKLAAAVAAALVVIVLVILFASGVFKPQDKTTTPPVSADFDNVHVVDANEPVSPNPEATAQPDEAAKPEESPEATDAPAPVDDETEAGANADEVEELDDTVYVTGSGVNLRTGPGTTYEVIGSLARGTELKRTGTTNGWSRVIYNDETCYISSALVSTDAPEVPEEEEPASETETEQKNMVVVVAKANVRSGPGTGYQSLGVLEVGEELETTGTSGSWTIVQYNGEEGYIFSSLVASKGEPGTVTVTADANVRAGDGTEYDIVGKVKAGDVLTMTDHTESNWYKVELADGQTGYIAGNMVQENG